MTLALVCSNVLALEWFGEARSVSQVGERLHVEIPLSVPADETLNASCFRLIRPRIADGLPYVRQGSLSLRPGTPGVLIVRSAGFIEEPTVRFGLQVGCGYNIERDFSLLLSTQPPENLPAATREAPLRIRATSAEPIPPARPAIAPAPAPARARPSPLPAVPAKPAATPALISTPTSAPTAAAAPILPPASEAVETTRPDRLRLSAELATQPDESAPSTQQRELLRLEFSVLQTVNDSTRTPAEILATLRRLDPSPETLPAPNALSEAHTTAPASATARPALPSAPPAPDENRFQFLGLAAALLALIGALFWYRRRQAMLAKKARERSQRIKSPPPSRHHMELEALERSMFAEPPPAKHQAQPSAVPAPTPPPVLTTRIEEHETINPVMELADIMLSFGRVNGAAQALREFIDQNPQQALQPWIRLLDVYRLAGMRSDFERIATELNRHFNVEIQRWDSSPADPAAADAPPGAAPDEPLPIAWVTTTLEYRGIEDLGHISEQVVHLWPTETCRNYLDHLLRDNRGGQRGGFSLPVVDDLLFLIELLDARRAMTAEADAPAGSAPNL